MGKIHHSDNDKHVDESEVFKMKSFMAAKNRKRMAKITNILLIIAAVAIVAACFFAYFFDR
ncbi:MAG: hypothetical protein Q4D41_06260 [Prevotellaceae bacterium]|nr:hypothetical protein [Prevotellaceae bacterium]